MLDAILRGHRSSDIDWIHVQRFLNTALTKFLRAWLLVMLIIPPFIVLGYGYSSLVIRMLVVALLVGIGWLVWLIRALFARDSLVWKSTLASWLTIGLLVLVIIIFTATKGNASHALNHAGVLAWTTMLLFVLLLLQEQAILSRFSLRARYVLVAFYVIATLYPVVLGMVSGISAIPISTAWSRYLEYGVAHFGIFGGGLGRATQAFWELAELVNLRTAGPVPVFSSFYLTLLWEGGALLALGMLAFAIIPLVASFRFARKSLKRLGTHARARAQFYSLQRLAWAGALWLMALMAIPVSFMSVLTTGFLVLLVAVQWRELLRDQARSVAQWRITQNWILVFLRIALLFLITITIIFAVRVVRTVQAQRSFASSIQPRTQAQGASIDLEKLARAVDAAPQNYGYRVARVGLGVELLSEAGYELLNSPNFTREFLEDINGDVVVLEQHYAKLSGQQLWQLAFSFARISVLAGNNSAWQQRTAEFYEHARARMPRNAVLAVEAARWYRLTPTLEKSKLRARALVEAALSIDANYALARVEQARLLAGEEKLDQALELLAPYANESADLAYEAARLALGLSQFSEAVEYYESAITQNPNHLQARFELVQAHIALGNSQEAEEELNSLSGLVAEDDVATQDVIQELRKLIETK